MYLGDPIPVTFEGILRTGSKDSSKMIHNSPFMKTRAYGDMEKLFDQNNMKYRNLIISPKKMKD